MPQCYLDILLDAESCTCIQTPIGSFARNRFPYGQKTPSEIFPEAVHAALADPHVVYCITDDVIFAGTGGDL